MSSERPIGGEVDSYDTWTMPPREQTTTSPVCRPFKIHWTAVSIVEILLMITAVIIYLFFPKKFLNQMLPKDVDDHDEVNELGEWLVRLFASMIVVQIVELMAGIGWGSPNARKIIYWGMLAGDIMLVAVYAACVHSMSEWHAVNIAIVTLASVFGLLRIITLILNPQWWYWGREIQNGLP